MEQVKYGRSIVSPAGVVRFVSPFEEHYNEAERVIAARGGTETYYDASTVLEGEGWVRVSDTDITTPNFNKVKSLTQAQRDAIFDMAMAANEAGGAAEWSARRWMAKLESIQD